MILWGGRNHNLVGRRRGLGKGGGWWECGGDKLEWRARPDDPFPCSAHIGELGQEARPVSVDGREVLVGEAG